MKRFTIAIMAATAAVGVTLGLGATTVASAASAKPAPIEHCTPYHARHLLTFDERAEWLLKRSPTNLRMKIETSRFQGVPEATFWPREHPANVASVRMTCGDAGAKAYAAWVANPQVQYVPGSVPGLYLLQDTGDLYGFYVRHIFVVISTSKIIPSLAYKAVVTADNKLAS